jgi:hypothetical protein
MQTGLFFNSILLTCGSAKVGTQVIVPYREEDEKRHLKVMGDLGQIVPMVCGPFAVILVVVCADLDHALGMGYQQRITDRRMSETFGYSL